MAFMHIEAIKDLQIVEEDAQQSLFPNHMPLYIEHLQTYDKFSNIAGQKINIRKSLAR